MTRSPTAISSCLLLVLFAQRTLAGDGAVALQTADPSCPDDSAAIYVDCGNGTVTDNRSGLVWLGNADCLGGGVDWYAAMDFVAALADVPDESAAAAHDCGLSDGSSPGEWRLPSTAEWLAMVSDAVDLNCNPAITSDLVTVPPCWSVGCNTAGLCSFSNVDMGRYWSSNSNVTTGATSAFSVEMFNGEIFDSDAKTSVYRVWPVRGGQ